MIIENGGGGGGGGHMPPKMGWELMWAIGLRTESTQRKQKM